MRPGQSKGDDDALPTGAHRSDGASLLARSQAFIESPATQNGRPLGYTPAICWCLGLICTCAAMVALDAISSDNSPSPAQWMNYAMLLVASVMLCVLVFIKRARAYSPILLTCGTCLTTCYIACRLDGLLTMSLKAWPTTSEPIKTFTVVDFLFQTPEELLGAWFFAVALLCEALQSSFVRCIGILPTAVHTVVYFLVFLGGPWLSANTYGSLFYIVLQAIGTQLFLVPSSVMLTLQFKKVQESQELLNQSQKRELAYQRGIQQADGVLSHILKNNIIDAKNSIDLFLDDVESRDILSHAKAILFRSMWWCRLREAVVQLVQGTYVKRPQNVSLSKFCNDLRVGRPAITLDCPSMTASLDPVACNVVLENAVANAIRHGDTENPEIKLKAEVVEHASSAELSFTLINRAKADRPKLAHWHASNSDTVSVVVDRYDSVSTGLGLQHIAVAARECGMAVELWQEDVYVHFRLSMRTEVSPGAETVSDGSQAEGVHPTFPLNVHILCVDDSPITRKCLDRVLPQRIPGAVVKVFGETVSDVALFKQAVAEQCDIAIVDQNLSLPGADIKGTDLIKELVSAGYTGLVCVHSANCTAKDMAEYLKSGAHCAVDKDMTWGEKVKLLGHAYTKHTASQNLPDIPWTVDNV
uniref:Response regulatory domain-containing protein n=1 Tax=Eutreptiella gymnastica TaxID=73025 RepID=A0A7S4CV05_9EUGL